MRWVLDTNVVFSGTISTEAPPYRVLKSSLRKSGPETVYSDPVLDEYTQVLQVKGPEFGLERKDTVRLLALINSRWLHVEPSQSFDVVDEDPHDDKFFEAAVAGKADYLVSGDNAVLNVEEFRGVKTLSPGEAEELLRQ